MYKNAFKKDYVTDSSFGPMLIGNDSCHLITNEIAYLIEVLPAEGDRDAFIKVLKNEGVENSHDFFERLIDLEIINAKKKLEIKDIAMIAKDKLLHPMIILIPAWIQERILNRTIEKLHRRITLNMMLVCSFIAIVLMTFTALLYDNLLADYYPVTQGNAQFLIVTILSVLGIIIHELGHSSACAYVDIGFRPIGFTLLIIYPAFFTNVSGVEKLNLREKCLVNLAGLGTQSIYMMTLCLIFAIYPDGNIKSVLELLFLALFFNFHPFLRTDGYWFFRDILSSLKDNRYYHIINKVYYLFFGLFTLYFVQKAFYLGKAVIIYLMNYQDIRVDMVLFMRLFNLYFLILICRASYSRTKEVIENLMSKEELSDA